MAAHYPDALAYFTVKQNNETLMDAGDINTVQDEVYATQLTVGVDPQLPRVRSYPEGIVDPVNVSGRIALAEKNLHTVFFSITGTIATLPADSLQMITWGSFIYNSHNATKFDPTYLNLPSPLYVSDDHNSPWLIVLDAQIKTTTTVPATRPEFTIAVSKRIPGSPPTRQLLTSIDIPLMLRAKTSGTNPGGQHIPMASTEFFTPLDSVAVEVACSSAWNEAISVNLSMMQIRA